MLCGPLKTEPWLTIGHWPARLRLVVLDPFFCPIRDSSNKDKVFEIPFDYKITNASDEHTGKSKLQGRATQ